jgi:hypothetical protein
VTEEITIRQATAEATSAVRPLSNRACASGLLRSRRRRSWERWYDTAAEGRPRDFGFRSGSARKLGQLGLSRAVLKHYKAMWEGRSSNRCPLTLTLTLVVFQFEVVRPS